MTTPFLLSDLRRDEGLRLTAYPDPLTHSAPWTIGYGHTGPDVRPGMVWSVEEAETTLAHDVAHITAALTPSLAFWACLAPLRQDVLVNMAFNMGVHGLLSFHHTLAAVAAGDWQAVHDNMLASTWARQLPHRAQRLALQMLTGVHA